MDWTELELVATQLELTHVDASESSDEQSVRPRQEYREEQAC
jgi:hypothetical protein